MSGRTGRLLEGSPTVRRPPPPPRCLLERPPTVSSMQRDGQILQRQLVNPRYLEKRRLKQGFIKTEPPSLVVNALQLSWQEFKVSSHPHLHFQKRLLSFITSGLVAIPHKNATAEGPKTLPGSQDLRGLRFGRVWSSEQGHRLCLPGLMLLTLVTG